VPHVLKHGFEQALRPRRAELAHGTRKAARIHPARALKDARKYFPFVLGQAVKIVEKIDEERFMHIADRIPVQPQLGGTVHGTTFSTPALKARNGSSTQ
jgi:hypothetical protein